MRIEIQNNIQDNIPKEIMAEVEKELEEMFAEYPKGLGFCHVYWAHKKKLLARRGYAWLSPAELNPHIIYD